MTPKLLASFVSLYVIGMIISMGCSGDFTSEDQWNDISEDMTGFSVAQVSGLSGIPIAFSGFVENGLPRMLTWNYQFLESDIGGLNIILQIFRVFLIIVCGVCVMWGIISQFQSYMIPALIGSGILFGIGSALS